MRVYLTGGTGLLGTHLATLLRERGHGVVALHRAGADTRLLAGAGCELVTGDVRDSAEELASGMKGCTHAVHSAALVYADGSWSTVKSVNVDGTENVARAAVQAGVEHFLHVSSVAVYGTTEGAVDESNALDTVLPEDDFYARSKREAESVVRRIEAESDLRVTVVRPSAVYGEHDRLMVPTIVDIVDRPLIPLFGAGDNTLPVVYAGNVAEAMLLALEAGRGNETFDVGCDYPLTQHELMTGMAEGLGRNPRLVRIPAPIVRGTVGLLSRVGLKMPGAEHLPLERLARLALGENPYPSRRIREELDWTPSSGHHDALVRSAAWFAHHSRPGETTRR